MRREIVMESSKKIKCMMKTKAKNISPHRIHQPSEINTEAVIKIKIYLRR